MNTTLCRKSYSGFLPQRKLTGWAGQYGLTVIRICYCDDPAFVAKLIKQDKIKMSWIFSAIRYFIYTYSTLFVCMFSTKSNIDTVKRRIMWNYQVIYFIMKATNNYDVMFVTGCGCSSLLSFAGCRSMIFVNILPPSMFVMFLIRKHWVSERHGVRFLIKECGNLVHLLVDVLTIKKVSLQIHR